MNVMRKLQLSIFTMLLASSVSFGATAADSLAFIPGKVIPMGESFLENLQKRDSILIADQVLYGCELKDVEEGTVLGFPEVKQEENASLMVLGEWQIDTGEEENNPIPYAPQFFNLSKLLLGYTHTEAGFRTIVQLDAELKNMEQLQVKSNKSYDDNWMDAR